MSNKLKPYMAYSRSSGAEEGAALVIAHHIREAKKMVWPVLRNWCAGIEFTDLAVRLLRDSHFLALADQAKLAAGEPHVIDSPVVCDHCEFWGFEVDADGRCAYCEEYAGDLLVGLHRDYEARQTAAVRAHIGDPCRKCGVNHNDVAVGDCPGGSPCSR